MPNVSSVHTNRALTNLTIARATGTFIADQLAPRIAVEKKSDTYYIVDAEREAIRQGDTVRAPGTVGTISDWDLSSDTYLAQDHAQVGFIPDEERSNADESLQDEIDKTKFLQDIIETDKEIKLESTLSSGISAGATPGVKWDQPTGDPIKDIRTGRQAIILATGMLPNVLMCDQSVIDALDSNPLIQDRIKYSSNSSNPAIADLNTYAQLFKVERIIVSTAQKNTAAKGATASISKIWGDTCYLAIAPTNPGRRTISMAFTFGWNGVRGAVGGRAVQTWREDKRASDWVRVHDFYDHKIVVAAAGYKLSSVLT